MGATLQSVLDDVLYRLREPANIRENDLKQLPALLLASLFAFVAHTHAESKVSPNYLPTVRHVAVYPEEARRLGTEGFCTVQFDITPEGSVSNARILRCSPTGHFEAAVIDAINLFHYRPRHIDGTPVAVDGMQETFWFSKPEVYQYSYIKAETSYNEVVNCSAVERRCEASQKAH